MPDQLLYALEEELARSRRRETHQMVYGKNSTIEESYIDTCNIEQFINSGKVLDWFYGGAYESRCETR